MRDVLDSHAVRRYGRVLLVSQASSAEVACMSSNTSHQNALVVAQDPETRATLQRVIGAASFDVHAPATIDEINAAQLEDYALLLIGTGSLQGTLADGLQALRGQTGPLPAGRIVLINEAQNRRAALDEICAHRADYVLPSGDLEDILQPTITKLVQEDYFGLDKYLSPDAPIRSWELSSSDDKRTV